jgi:hypothetical protein
MTLACLAVLAAITNETFGPPAGPGAGEHEQTPEKPRGTIF